MYPPCSLWFHFFFDSTSFGEAGVGMREEGDRETDDSNEGRKEPEAEEQCSGIFHVFPIPQNEKQVNT
jgi:hypothetical protein